MNTLTIDRLAAALGAPLTPEQVEFATLVAEECRTACKEVMLELGMTDSVAYVGAHHCCNALVHRFDLTP